jgi:phenylalanyl-tRNA synthetase beta chain
MQVPISWLREYVDFDLSPSLLAEKLTMVGMEVGSIESTAKNWEKCIVAKIIKINPHPNADKLRLCSVDYGNADLIEVVCGAPNISEGQKVVLAQIGAKLTDPNSGTIQTIKPTKIRGIKSEGMLCSETELGIGNDHSGIMILPTSAPTGIFLSDYLGDYILDIEVTANRPDGLSILGIAHEVAAICQTTVNKPAADYVSTGSPTETMASISIEDTDLCKRYMGAIISNISVKESPEWLKHRLKMAGMRSINNIVDVTNYVMLEYGQPMHAFDCDKLPDTKIVIRKAKPKEMIKTLDGIERILSDSMLLITNERSGPIALAGIIGGHESEVTNSTTTIFLESASFEPFSTRATASVIKTRTEASMRFEKGLRPHLPPMAINRAIHLILTTAGGSVAEGLLDIFPNPLGPNSIIVSSARIKRLLGLEISLESAKKILESLGMEFKLLTSDSFEVTPPAWRSDIQIPEDIIEEIARITGYDEFPMEALSGPISLTSIDPIRKVKESARDIMVSSGLQEIISYPLISEAQINMIDKSLSIQISNPISAAHEYLRLNMRHGLLKTMKINHRQLSDVPLWFFEVGSVYLPKFPDLPHEPAHLGGIIAGQGNLVSWIKHTEAPPFFAAKGIVELLCKRLRIKKLQFVPASNEFFSTGKSLLIYSEESKIGEMGEIANTILTELDIDINPVAFFELDLDMLSINIQPDFTYEASSPFPEAIRDLALVVNSLVPSEKIAKIITDGKLVKSATLFDSYQGSQIETGSKSLAYRVVFQVSNRTLTAEEVGKSIQAIIKRLVSEANATIRE